MVSTMNDARTEVIPVLALGAPMIGPVEPPLVHLMTYNLKSASGRAPHSWWKRRPLVQAVVQSERPTVLCTQEGRFRQLRELRDGLDGYDWIHLGRGGGSRSESTAILWDASRLAPVDYDHLWISKRPNVIGSRSWGSGTVRMLTWVQFEDKATGQDFHVVNVHLDHRSEKARQKGAGMCRDLLLDFPGPALLAGDFNCGPDSKAHRVLTDEGLADAWAGPAKRLTPDWSTFNNWKPDPASRGDRIDWIFTKQGDRRRYLTVERIGVNTRAEPDLTPSDHWPVQAVFKIGRQ